MERTHKLNYYYQIVLTQIMSIRNPVKVEEKVIIYASVQETEQESVICLRFWCTQHNTNRVFQFPHGGYHYWESESNGLDWIGLGNRSVESLYRSATAATEFLITKSPNSQN